MELTTLLPVLVALACPIAMGLMMWMMGRNMGGQTMTSEQSEAERLQALHTQRRQLEQEIAETEKIVALEAQKATRNGTHTVTGTERPQPIAEAQNSLS